MSLLFAHSIIQRLSALWPLLLHAAMWTILLSVTAAAASFAPAVTFFSVVSPSSSFSMNCNADGFVRIPVDIAGEIVCVPANLVNCCGFDFLVPTVLAASVVAGSVCIVRAFDLRALDMIRA